MIVTNGMPAAEALERLKAGNERYLSSQAGTGDVSPQIRKQTYENGQKPYAVIVTCSDSRVIPESIFSAGIGDLFVIRVAGNVIDDHQLGSIEYAAGHLSAKLIVVMGHTHCGAIDAAIEGDADGYIKFITDEIKLAIGDETDDYRACRLNVDRSISEIRKSPYIIELQQKKEVVTVGAVYHIEDGRVEFMDD